MSNQRKGTQDQIEVGEHIRTARKEMNLTQEKLAEQVGVDRNTVYRYETGQGGSMSIDIFFKFAGALNKTPNELAPSRFLGEDPESFVVAQELYQQYGKEGYEKIIKILKLFSELNT